MRPVELNSSRTVLIGIGNSSRSDDGMGWAFVEDIEKSSSFKGLSYLRYQLQIEDADLIKEFDHVIFVDSTQEITEAGYYWKECKPGDEIEFSTHALSPNTVLGLCEQVYKRTPRSFILGIQGYDWELKEGISDKARENLDNALKGFKERFLDDSQYIAA